MLGAYVIGCRGSFCFYSLLVSLELFVMGSTVWLWNWDSLFFSSTFSTISKYAQNVRITVICLGHSIFRLFILIIENEASKKKNWFNNKRHTRCWGTFVHSTQCMRPMHKKPTTTTATTTTNITEKEKKAKFSNDNLWLELESHKALPCDADQIKTTDHFIWMWRHFFLFAPHRFSSSFSAFTSIYMEREDGETANK